jgi:hypothetical protein
MFDLRKKLRTVPPKAVINQSFFFSFFFLEGELWLCLILLDFHSTKLQALIKPFIWGRPIDLLKQAYVTSKVYQEHAILTVSAISEMWHG